MRSVADHLDANRLELGRAWEAARKGHWRMARDPGGIAWLVLDRPGSGTNTVSAETLEGLDRLLDALEADPPRGCVIRSAKPGGFAAGADINDLAELAGDEAEALLRRGHAVLDRLEALGCPTVAVIHGAALGAGLELALACDSRIAIKGASVGFPEVRLGLHPGLGGTFRLTALIAPDEAMTLMLAGNTAHTAKALSLGIFDEVTEERHLAAAVRAAIDALPGRGLGAVEWVLGTAPGRAVAARRMRSTIAEKVREDHYPAPYRLIDLWENHGGDPAKMQEAEIASFAKLLKTDTAKNLVRAFFLRQQLKRGHDAESRIKHVHVVGAGEMGREIAAWAAIKGCRVTLSDLSLDALGSAVRKAAEICETEHLDPPEKRDALDRMMPDPNGYGAACADLVIEAVPEDAELKRKIYDKLGRTMKKGAILASNTSSLRLAVLADGLADPANFAGLHFFNPASRMQLIEVGAQGATDDVILDRLAAFCREIDRLPVRVADEPGFLVNRALMPYLLEALILVEEGVDREAIDAAMLDFGMPMGPVTLADQIGLDICLDVAKSLTDQLDRPMPEIPRRLRDMVEKGNTGKKAGQGFYDWSSGTPEPKAGADAVLSRDLTDRLILAMCDACVECLRKGVVRNADDIDAAMIFATGFAPFRGGPIRYARSRGLAEVRARLLKLSDKHGPRFRPDEGWADLD
ncbi:3-hydroxyacyl-CoA dehydrogenase NAD-binding domain-containing protein [Ruegeria marina]|uniref:enoyl-CoA hydratase n=1 Tax=Ruegeria marina TaxID=639004 RepID=A0A1G6UWZ1_9RHOB|nr:3-hydroxyacyl-CoA dehydrogenase NAD-binding domain-containing protein [Ruegeria marina]SDD45880.1 3-hydroxyacyl-CoA dehydrogenase / enoyl-CoA hydratase / 3-hydroxybutyryl-CoA epimerase [Ruegeria marina]